MKLKSAVFAVCVLLIFSILLTGCGGNVNYSAAEICDTLAAFALDSENRVEVTIAQIENHFDFKGEELEDYKILLSTDDEKYSLVAVVKPKDAENEQLVLNAFNTNVSEATNSFKIASPNESKKIMSRLIYELDGMYILVIADDYTACKNYLEEIKAKPIQ